MDGPAKVTGKALYVDDLHPPGVLYGATVRSTLPRGRLRSLQPDPAFDWTGLTVVTAGDVPRNVVALIEDDQPILVPVGGEIRHRAEALALVAGEDRERVARAAVVFQPANDLPQPPAVVPAAQQTRFAQSRRRELHEVAFHRIGRVGPR